MVVMMMVLVMVLVLMVMMMVGSDGDLASCSANRWTSSRLSIISNTLLQLASSGFFCLGPFTLPY